MKLKHLIIFISLSTLSSCATYYYTPAMFQNDVQYMVKPSSKDSIKQGLYASGILFAHSGGNDQGDDGGGLINLYYSKTFENVNMSAGVLGFAGSFDNGDQSSSATFKTKSFYGAGGNASISGYIPFKNADWRILGVDVIYTTEGGSYADFRKGPKPTSTSIYSNDYTLISQTNMFTYGIFTEVVARPSDEVSLAFKLGINRTGGEVAQQINTHIFQNIGFNAVVGYREFSFISAIKARPTEVFLMPVGVQLGVAYRIK